MTCIVLIFSLLSMAEKLSEINNKLEELRIAQNCEYAFTWNGGGIEQGTHYFVCNDQEHAFGVNKEERIE